MVGPDYPFNIMEKRLVARIDALRLAEAARRQMRIGNARRFLGL